MRGRVTKAAVDREIANAVSRKESIRLYDETLKGFGFTASKTGSASYFIEYKLGGRGSPSKRMTLGKHGPLTPEAARNIAKDKLGEVARGTDVAQVKKDGRKKLAGAKLKDAIERFLSQHEKKTRYWHEKRQRLLGSDLKTLLGKEVCTITSAQLEEALDKVQNRSASAHRLLFADLRPFFKWAKKRYELVTNPMADADAPKPVKKRDRKLEDYEIKAFWQACDEMPWPFASIYKLALLTGARREEIACMHWAELDLDAGVWTLPAQENFTFQRKRRDGTELIEGRTKNSLEHHIPLAPSAIALLDRAAVTEAKTKDRYPLDTELVFSTTGRTPPSGWSRIKRQLDLRMAELLGSKYDQKAKTLTGGRFKAWRMHDLRRTCATGMEDLGFDTRIVEAALNHISGTKAGIIGVYQTSQHREKRRTAFLAWERRVLEIIGEAAEAPNVVSLRKVS